MSRFKQATLTVTVNDGLLTIDANGGTNTKINYASIQPLNDSPLAATRVGLQQQFFVKPQIFVYPNPFADKFTTETLLRGAVSVSLYDLMGNRYYQAIHQLESGDLQVDLSASHIKAGVYLLKLQAEDGKRQLIKVLKK